ncbi:rRNA maturation RNase YbeY [Criblamydia sequanensis]|uniref:Endoribonuclease YbeY n=1 Tax=Candidatus Criblamydia sequanensis CRIB-18 TaxID=1437425 RepID=A0A090D079_9BACT|nr:rRNA maturation RNase YbeY [Criblamydia sequanensis]CDR33205.1 Conserved hypothetical protein [Criblamydia sequanensis CRIB-18]
MKVLVQNNQKDLKIKALQVKQLVKEALDFKKVPTKTVSIYFVTKKTISALHDEFFNDPSPTDCISFPLDPSDDEPDELSCLGEIFVCPKVAIEYASSENLPVNEEVSLYIIHGLLHLIGYDDITEIERKVMRSEEKKIMNHLKKQKLILEV